VATDSPTVARRQLRQALRRAREARSLTQGQVAEALEWSLSKVNRIESGDVTVSNTDLRALLSLLEIKSVVDVTKMVETGRVARRREDPHPHITPAMRQMFEYEREAISIRGFQPTLIPGLFQTPEYASSILGFWHDRGVLSEEQRATRLEIRTQRRRRVLEGERAPHYLQVLDESVVQRIVGGPQTTADQLRDLARSARSGQVEVRILPLSNGTPLSNIGAFMIFDLPGEENAVMYTEAPRSDNIVQDQADLLLHRRIYDLMLDLSLSGAESVDFLEKASESLSNARR